MICNGPDSQNPLIKTNLVFKVISMFTPEGKFKTSIFKQITWYFMIYFNQLK